MTDFLLAWVVLLASAAITSAQPVADDVAVRNILAVRCSECHGAQLAEPDGKFGHILDLKRIITDGLIVPGDPDESELFQLIDFDEMPTSAAKNGPVSAVEKQVIRRWIAEGAKVDPVALDLGPAPHRPGDVIVETEAGGGIVELLGRFHPAAVHFPVALLIAALLAELLGMCCCGGSMRPAVRFMMWLAVPAAAVAAVLGFIQEDFGTYTGERRELLDQHLWSGMTATVLALIGLVVLEVSTRRNADALRWVFRILLVLAAVVVGLTGHWGGLISNGLDWYHV